MIDLLKSIEIKDAFLVLTGGVLTIIIGYFSGIAITRREGKQKIAEKIVERKLAAYEDYMTITKSLRKMNFLEERVPVNFPFNEEFASYRYPVGFYSKEVFNDWIEDIIKIFERNGEWLNNDATREFNYFQDYIINVDILASGLKNNDNIKLLGVVLRQDFINISAEMEKISFHFYSKKVFNLNFENKRKWHKYPKEKTMKRFEKTHLQKYENYIRSL